MDNQEIKERMELMITLDTMAFDETSEVIFELMDGGYEKRVGIKIKTEEFGSVYAPVSIPDWERFRDKVNEFDRNIQKHKQ